MSADKSQQSYYWSELAEMNHAEQVSIFDWCSCEDNEGGDNPYADCPRPELATHTRQLLFWSWKVK